MPTHSLEATAEPNQVCKPSEKTLNSGLSKSKALCCQVQSMMRSAISICRQRWSVVHRTSYMLVTPNCLKSPRSQRAAHSTSPTNHEALASIHSAPILPSRQTQISAPGHTVGKLDQISDAKSSTHINSTSVPITPGHHTHMVTDILTTLMGNGLSTDGRHLQASSHASLSQMGRKERVRARLVLLSPSTTGPKYRTIVYDEYERERAVASPEGG